ncbi:MAG: hypothetical protein Q9N67_05420 [Ghiorsea sp.]|nr:hypothetical protein [Ghiorsea sp.]
MILITKEANNTFAKEAEMFGFTLLNHPIEASVLRHILGER